MGSVHLKVEVDTSIAYHSSRGKDADNGPLTSNKHWHVAEAYLFGPSGTGLNPMLLVPCLAGVKAAKFRILFLLSWQLGGMKI
jgi:hypothetical protein